MKRALLICFLLPSFLLSVAGCDQHDDASTGDNLITLRGVGFQPVQLTGSKVAASNLPFQVFDFAKAAKSQIVAEGVTDNDGRYDVVITQSKAVAVIITGAVRVSGLISADETDFSKDGLIAKDFDQITDVACEAGVTAILEGARSAEDFTSERIANLEAAAAIVDPSVNHADPASVTAGAAQVRQLTDDGDHLP